MSRTKANTSNYFCTFILPTLKVNLSKYLFYCHPIAVITFHFPRDNSSFQNSHTESAGTLGIINLNSNSCSPSASMQACISLFDSSYLVFGISRHTELWPSHHSLLRKVQQSHLMSSLPRKCSVAGILEIKLSGRLLESRWKRENWDVLAKQR